MGTEQEEGEITQAPAEEQAEDNEAAEGEAGDYGGEDNGGEDNADGGQGGGADGKGTEVMEVPDDMVGKVIGTKGTVIRHIQDLYAKKRRGRKNMFYLFIHAWLLYLYIFSFLLLLLVLLLLVSTGLARTLMWPRKPSPGATCAS